MSPSINESSIDLFSAILMVGAAQGLFLILVILAAPKEINRANVFLAGLVFAFVLELLNRFAVSAGYITRCPQMVTLNWALDLFYGPLIFVYVRLLTTTRPGIRHERLYLHFMLPVLGMLLASSLWLLYTDLDFLAVVYSSAAKPLNLVELALALLGLVSMVVYLACSFRLLRGHRRAIRANYSYREKIDLIWLRNLLAVMATLLSLYIFLTLLGRFVELFTRLYAISMVITVFGIGFLGVRQPAVFVKHRVDDAEFLTPPVADNIRQEPKYKKSALSESEISSIYTAISDLMDNEKVYLESDLSLPGLADKLGLPGHYISQAINQGSGSNFFDFVNKRRVRHVSSLLTGSADNPSANVLQMAMNAGFNSKSTFYTAFKKHTGVSPKQFQKSVSLTHA